MRLQTRHASKQVELDHARLAMLAVILTGALSAGVPASTDIVLDSQAGLAAVSNAHALMTDYFEVIPQSVQLVPRYMSYCMVHAHRCQCAGLSGASSVLGARSSNACRPF